MTDQKGIHSIVMSPEEVSSASNDADPNSPPTFVSKETSKTRYRYSLRRWLQPINDLAEKDSKFEGVLKGVGNRIYLCCDFHSRDLLTRAENSGKLSLRGSDEDPSRTNLFESIIEIITRDAPSEMIKREIDLLTEIYSCTRTNGEKPLMYATRFSSTLTQYINVTGPTDDRSSHQFAALLLQNSNLTPDTFNSVMFQISAMAARRLNDKETQNLNVPRDELLMILSTLRKFDNQHLEKHSGKSRQTLNRIEAIRKPKRNKNTSDFVLQYRRSS